MKKNMKKVLMLGVLGMFMLVFAMTFVVAAEGDAIEKGTNAALEGISSVMNPIFGWLLGSTSDTSELVIKVLAFLMVSIVIFGVMDQTGIVDNKWLNTALGVIVATIGVRFMPKNLLTALTAPSSAFVLIIFMGIPFFAFFFVVNKMKSGFARRLSWIMYAVLIGVVVGYNVLWGNAPGHDAFYAYWWIYAIFAGMAAILAAFDGTWRRIWADARSDAREARVVGVEVAEKEDEVYRLKKALANIDPTKRERVKAAKNRIKKAEGQLANLRGLGSDEV